MNTSEPDASSTSAEPTEDANTVTTAESIEPKESIEASSNAMDSSDHTASQSTLPDIGSNPDILNDVNNIFDANSIYDPTNPINMIDYPMYDIYSATDSSFDISKDYLTPQQFGAKGDGVTDDSSAFREMFAAAYAASLNQSSWRRCKTIYIPSGIYLINKPIIDESLTTKSGEKVRYAMFEVCGAGRENTMLKLGANCEVMFDNQISDKNDPRVIFGFTTFRNIGFDGSNDKHTFMNLRDGNKVLDSSSPYYNKKVDGPQRLQFLSCSFSNWAEILNCLPSTIMLSEFTFAYCKISNCGEATKDSNGELTNPCHLFILDDAQAVNWRFIATDIEDFCGDAFYFERATGICLIGGSIIPNHSNGKGTEFDFNYDTIDKRNSAGRGNSPQILCYGTRFEIWKEDTLVKSVSVNHGQPYISFQSCIINATDQAPKNLFVVDGAIDAYFHNCFGCDMIRINGDCTKTAHMYMPKFTFMNCPDMNVDYLVKNSDIKGTKGALLGTNNCRIIVDDTYDFYLYNNGYLHTLTELNECRQTVNLTWRQDPDTKEYNYSHFNHFGITNGLTIPAKPYGYVKYIELNVLNEENFNGEITLKLYDKNTSGTRRQLGEDVKLSFDSNKTHIIYINDFVDDLEIVFSHSYSTNPNVSMNMQIVKY